MCFDCKKDPCGCNYQPVKNSVQGIRCYSLPGYGLVKYWPKKGASKEKIEVHLHVTPGEFPELEKIVAALVARVGKPEEHL